MFNRKRHSDRAREIIIACLLRNEIEPGLEKEKLLALIGEPLKVVPGSTDRGPFEQLVYPGIEETWFVYIYVEKGKVTAVHY